MNDFTSILRDFTDAVINADGARLASLFTSDGVYEDYFFGPHQGAEAISAMLARFYEGGAQFRWDFFNPVSDSRGGYAQYHFSYRSKVAESAGQIVGFEGISRFELADGKIARYSEVFDRGAALAALQFSAERSHKILTRYWDAYRGSPAFASHRKR
jgi:limonene-1,2-epoxide hydrolase